MHGQDMTLHIMGVVAVLLLGVGGLIRGVQIDCLMICKPPVCMKR
jgi:hypothetical protein